MRWLFKEWRGSPILGWIVAALIISAIVFGVMWGTDSGLCNQEFHGMDCANP